MAISEKDIKLLWGRASGICSRPGCGADLTRTQDWADDYVVGEMAHVIARSKDGPRGDGKGGEDTYDNLILLCPTCHRDVDKAPGSKFPAWMLHEWKVQHEARRLRIGAEEVYETSEKLRAAISMILVENHETWRQFGPQSEVALRNPASNVQRVWEMRRADKIVPNNRRIINVIRANQDRLTQTQAGAFAKFVIHAEAFEENLYDRLDEYPLFPQQFAEAFK